MTSFSVFELPGSARSRIGVEPAAVRPTVRSLALPVAGTVQRSEDAVITTAPDFASTVEPPKIAGAKRARRTADRANETERAHIGVRRIERIANGVGRVEPRALIDGRRIRSIDVRAVGEIDRGRADRMLEALADDQPIGDDFKGSSIVVPAGKDRIYTLDKALP